MSVSPQYETYEYTARGPGLRAQSIVESRLEGRADDRLLALSPRVVYGGAEVLSGEVRYGGKLFFSAVLASPDGSVAGVERGAEFSHRAPCEDAAPAQRAEVALHVEKAEYRLEGRSLILSAIVRTTWREVPRMVLPTRQTRQTIWSIMECLSVTHTESWDSWCWFVLKREFLWMNFLFLNIRRSVRSLRKISMRRSV